MNKLHINCVAPGVGTLTWDGDDDFGAAVKKAADEVGIYLGMQYNDDDFLFEKRNEIKRVLDVQGIEYISTKEGFC